MRINNSLNILMLSHHGRHKIFPRTYSMARALVDRGHRVTLLSIDETNRYGIRESTWDGIRLIETPDLLWGKLRSGWDVWDTFNRLVFLEQDKTAYDLIQCRATRPVTIYPALYLAHRRKIPLFIDWIDWYGRGGLVKVNRPQWYRLFFSWLDTYYEEGFLSKAAGISVISTALMERAITLGIPKERLCYLPGGTHPDRFPVRSKNECRDQLGFPLEDPMIGFSSADSHFDLEIVMQALHIVAQRYPSVKLLITGKRNPHVLRLAQKHQVENHLIQTGFLSVEELPTYLSCADLFVLPFPETVYNLGRWPNKIGDYMCLGRPIVSNPVGEIKALFSRHQIGLLAEWDASDFARKIMQILENPNMTQPMVQKALQVSSEEYAWKVLITRLEEFYLKILNRDDKACYSPVHAE